MPNLIDITPSTIDLGSYGQLISPVTVDGVRKFYFYDVNKDRAYTGDGLTHDYLDSIFKYDSNLNNLGAGDTTTTKRYANINGWLLALPTYQDLLSVGDSLSPLSDIGNGLKSNGWPYAGSHYWAADLLVAVNSKWHYEVTMSSNTLNYASFSYPDTTYMFVALEVLSLDQVSISLVTSTQLGGLSASQVSSLSTTQLSELTSTQLGGLSATGVGGLSTLQLATLSSTQLSGLSSSGVSGFSTLQLAALSSAQLVGLSPAGISVLSSSQVATLTTTQLSGLTSSQVGSFQGYSLYGLNVEQIQSLTPIQLSGLNSSQALLQSIDLGGDPTGNYRLNLISPCTLNIDGISKTFYYLDANNNGKSDINPTGPPLDAVLRSQLDVLFANGNDTSSSNRSVIFADYKLTLPTVAELQAIRSMFGGPPAGWGAVGASTYHTADLFASDQHKIYGLSSGLQYSRFEERDSISSQFVCVIVEKIGIHQTSFDQIISRLTPNQLTALSSTQLGGLSAAGVSGLSASQVSSLTTMQLSGLTNTQLSSLSSTGVSGLSASQVSSLTTTQLSGLISTQLSSLSSTGVSGLSASQVSSLTTT